MRRNGFWLIALLPALGCRDGQASEIRVVLGDADAERFELRPKSALAEYVVVPGVKQELRVTLADFDVPCGEFVEPDAGRTSITLSLLSPPGAPPTPASYHWSGEPPTGLVTARVAIPGVRHGARGMVLPGGGFARLAQVDLSSGGAIEGIVDFESPAAAGRPATSLRGRFSARVCRGTSPP